VCDFVFVGADESNVNGNGGDERQRDDNDDERRSRRRTAADAAREFGVPPTTVQAWLRCDPRYDTNTVPLSVPSVDQPRRSYVVCVCHAVSY